MALAQNTLIHKGFASTKHGPGDFFFKRLDWYRRSAVLGRSGTQHAIRLHASIISNYPKGLRCANRQQKTFSAFSQACQAERTRQRFIWLLFNFRDQRIIE